LGQSPNKQDSASFLTTDIVVITIVNKGYIYNIL
jgi:hypothetical protein